MFFSQDVVKNMGGGGVLLVHVERNIVLRRLALATPKKVGLSIFSLEIYGINP